MKTRTYAGSDGTIVWADPKCDLIIVYDTIAVQ
jgi:hypothetical protein